MLLSTLKIMTDFFMQLIDYYVVYSKRLALRQTFIFHNDIFVFSTFFKQN